MLFIRSTTTEVIVKIGHKDTRTSCKDVSENNRKTVGACNLTWFWYLYC